MVSTVAPALIVIVALEGVFGFFKPDLHIVHAPLPDAPAHCHAEEGCADSHWHAGRHVPN